MRRVVGLRLEEAIARLLPAADDTAAETDDAGLGDPVPGIAAGYRRAFAVLRERPDFDEFSRVVSAG